MEQVRERRDIEWIIRGYGKCGYGRKRNGSGFIKES